MRAKQENIVKERERKLAQRQLEKEREQQRQLEAKQAEKNRQKKQVGILNNRTMFLKQIKKTKQNKVYILNFKITLQIPMFIYEKLIFHNFFVLRYCYM